MIVGIKYCGGCNPLYDRVYQMAELKRQFPNHEYRYISESKECDVWLVVCGCVRACAYIDDLIANEQIFILDSEAKFEETKKYLKEN